MMLILQKKKILLSDEAHFHPGSYVNQQNCRTWGSENPLAHISFGGLRNHYLQYQIFFGPSLHSTDVNDVWFQQDGKTCHNRFIPSNF